MNKLSFPAAIVIGSVVLGGFYYASQVSKQNSIERQQMAELKTQKEQADSERLAKVFCAAEAKESATEQYKETCTYDCKEGYYYTANYDSYYQTCLQARGLD